jgi:hypothetical protein
MLVLIANCLSNEEVKKIFMSVVVSLKLYDGVAFQNMVEPPV